MDNNNNKREKIIIFILGAVLIIAVLSIIAIFSSAIMRLLGFEYESVGGFILYFIIASIVSYPMNLIAGALPKALLNLDRITRKTAVCVYVLLDTITTFFGFYIVDYFAVIIFGMNFRKFFRHYISSWRYNNKFCFDTRIFHEIIYRCYICI